METKEVRIPVASHGLHDHPFNYPYVGTTRFMEVFPCYYEPLRIGESTSPKGGMYSILLPMVQNAFITGRYHFKGVFVPYTFVYKPWYHFQKGLSYQKADGTSMIFSQSPNTSHGVLSEAFLTYNDGGIRFIEVVSNPSQSAPYNYDILFYGDGGRYSHYKLTNEGARVLKVLNSLGISPSWISGDTEPIDLLAPLCYIKAFLDVYFPGQYIGTKFYFDILEAIKPESFDYSEVSDITNLFRALLRCSTLFYDRSFFDYAWDTPSGPNSNNVSKITISDQTYAAVPEWDSSDSPRISNDGSIDSGIGAAPSNGAFIGNSPIYAGEPSFMGRVTKFALQALESIANFMRRNQLAGSRLVDQFLADRGFHLGNMDAQESFVMGDRYVEMDVQAVENNSNTNLGELAGRGIASTRVDKPLEFSCTSKHDGIFFVFCSVEPDCDMPVYNDQFSQRVFQNDFYQAKFDKLGVEGIRQIGVFASMSGALNRNCQDKLFAFLNRYWGEIQEKPRLVGDFRYNTRGAAELSKYHAMRTFSLGTVLGSDGLYHSLDFINASGDMNQYQRLFYDEINDSMLLCIRWYGNLSKEKLPLGDSFDWDDDEYNKKVTIVNQGMKG